jgi:hypothetical protein
MHHRLLYFAVAFVGAPAAFFLFAIVLKTAIRSRRLPLCPICGRSKVRRSQMNNLIDQALRVLMLSPCRCKGCLTRFYAFQWKALQLNQ